MKTKAYKLAAELGLQEDSVLEWLRDNGYPNARRADTIRSEVAQAARQALGSRAARPTPPRPPTARPAPPPPPPRAAPPPAPRPPPPQSRKSRQQGGPTAAGDGFKVSFAELLENHLPGDVTAGLQALPETRPAIVAVSPPAASPRVTDSRDDLKVRIARAEAERDRLQQKLDVEKARAEGYIRDAQRLDAELATARQALAALEPLREDNDRLELDRTRLRHELAVVTDERATLEQTCTDLQQELTEARAAIEEARRGDIEYGTVLGDLETARQREIAWRTRALELERAVAQGGDIIRLLKGQGLEAFRQQVRVLQTLLADEATALQLLKSIRQVDAPALEKLVEERLRRTCAHPLCNRVTRAADKVPLRVDDDRECTVCGGDPEKRWFHHMVQECAGAGVRRLLVIGGAEATQSRLRALSEGEPVDLRLVSADEEVLPARAAGRVEGCDALILWSRWVVPSRISEAYAEAALAADRPIVSVLGVTCSVVALARATVNRLARTHVLRAV